MSHLILTHLGFSRLKEDLEKIKAIFQTLLKPEGVRCGNCEKPLDFVLQHFWKRCGFVKMMWKALGLEDGSSTINAKMGTVDGGWTGLLLSLMWLRVHCTAIMEGSRTISGTGVFKTLELAILAEHDPGGYCVAFATSDFSDLSKGTRFRPLFAFLAHFRLVELRWLLMDT